MQLRKSDAYFCLCAVSLSSDCVNVVLILNLMNLHRVLVVILLRPQVLKEDEEEKRTQREWGWVARHNKCEAAKLSRKPDVSVML